ncbi:MAG: hypothetical protein IKC53_09655 [Lentisphaeria bacterium]|nr:hypothetical protein [Lentisphaeria bacterium]
MGRKDALRPRVAGGGFAASVASLTLGIFFSVTARRARQYYMKVSCLSEAKHNRHGRLAFPACCVYKDANRANET